MRKKWFYLFLLGSGLLFIFFKKTASFGLGSNRIFFKDFNFILAMFRFHPRTPRQDKLEHENSTKLIVFKNVSVIINLKKNKQTNEQTLETQTI